MRVWTGLQYDWLIFYRLGVTSLHLILWYNAMWAQMKDRNSLLLLKGHWIASCWPVLGDVQRPRNVQRDCETASCCRVCEGGVISPGQPRDLLMSGFMGMWHCDPHRSTSVTGNEATTMNQWVVSSEMISLQFVRKGPINNNPALVQIMAWRRPGDKPLSAPMLVSLPTHIIYASLGLNEFKTPKLCLP